MFNLICLFVLCVVVYKIMSGVKFSLPSFKGIFKHCPKVKGEEMTLMSKKCEICGEKTIYLKGDNTSSLKPINIVDPDSGEVTTKFACDKCYEELMSFMKQEKKDSINLSPELKKLADMLKNS
mgnify:CR=1 FL=1